MSKKNVLIYITVLLVSFIGSGFLFSLLVSSNIVSPQSYGVQTIAQMYNAIGYKISTPELTIELVERAIKEDSANKIMEYVDPRLDRESKKEIAKTIYQYYENCIDLHLKSIDTDDDGILVAQIIATKADGSQFTDDFIKLKKSDDKWYIHVPI